MEGKTERRTSMLVTLSSKGQLVIPKPVREALNVSTGDQFRVQIVDGKILLEPIAGSLVDRLYGKFDGEDLLSDLEEEHRQELKNE
jgi:AbrB family looped-hinge helix DNA binding protein